LEAKGHSVTLKTIKNHTHNYYPPRRDRDGVASTAGTGEEAVVRANPDRKRDRAFLKEQRLAQNPKFKEYDLK
jgi:hypothetical protein